MTLKELNNCINLVIEKYPDLVDTEVLVGLEDRHIDSITVFYNSKTIRLILDHYFDFLIKDETKPVTLRYTPLAEGITKIEMK